MEIVNTVGIAVVLFATTNIDDIFVLLGFFSDKQIKARQVIIGQYIGIAALVLVSVAASLVSLVFKPEHIGLLGLLPVLIGLKKLYDLCRGSDDDEQQPKIAGASNILAVAGVTMANGGDNIGIYTPVFATSSAAAIITYGAVFAVMVAVWLFFSHWLVNHPALGAPIRRYGDRVTPFVLILLGLYILYEAGSFGMLA